MKIGEYDKKVYGELNTYISEELNKNDIEYNVEYIEDYGNKYELIKVGKYGNIRIVLESSNECRRSNKSKEVDILSFFCHFYEYHNEDKVFDQTFNSYSGKYNIHTKSENYEQFIADVKRIIKIITNKE